MCTLSFLNAEGMETDQAGARGSRGSWCRTPVPLWPID